MATPIRESIDNAAAGNPPFAQALPEPPTSPFGDDLPPTLTQPPVASIPGAPGGRFGDDTQNQPSQNVSIGSKITVRTSETAFERLFDNPLNDYLDVTYNLTMGLVRESKLRAIQEALPSGANMSSMLGRDDVRVFASTGEASTNIISSSRLADRINYYNIRAMTMENLMGHQPQNPLMSTMYDMKIKLYEPYGFRFNEDMRLLGEELGYTDIAPGRFVYRVELWFSGYKQTGQWVDKIPIASFNQRTINKLTYFVVITQVDGRVTATGTEYDLSITPLSHFAWRPEDMTTEASSVWSGEGNTFGDFLKDFARNLRDQKVDRSHGILDREYEFIVPNILRDAQFNTSMKASEHGYVKFKKGGGYEITSGEKIDIQTVLLNVMADLPVVQDLRLQENDNDDFLRPTIAWNIRFNTIYGNEQTPEIYDYKKVKYQYIIEPFITFKRGPITPKNFQTMTKTENQTARVKEMLRYRMIVRVYDYLFSGGNSEVIDCEFRYRAFWYESLDTFDDSLEKTGLNTGETVTVTAEQRKGEAIGDGGVEVQNSPGNADLDSQFTRLTGVRPNVAGSLAGPAEERMKREAFGVNNLQYSQNADSSEKDAKKQRYMQASDLYVRNDMLQAEIEVRGDPIWMFNPYLAEGDLGLTLPGEDSKIRPQTDKVIFLKAFSPTQTDFMNPQRRGGSSQPTLLAGFYGVVKVTSMFDGGKFRQKLLAYKYPHLNYVITTLKEVTP